MRHKIKDDVNVNVSLDIPVDDVEEIVDHIADAMIKVAVVFTACRILKSIFETPN